jgi:DNA polymerase III epsilon subunit-like protein
MSVIVTFDFETGGILPDHPSIQLAAVAWDNGVELGAFEQKIAFTEADADPTALAMNHYTAQAWVDAKPPVVVAAKFAAWLKPYCAVKKTSKAGSDYYVARLAGYNAAAFDAPRLRDLFGALFLPGEYPVRDVLQRAIFYFDEHPDVTPPANLKLATVCQFFNIDTTGAHDALTDSRLCAELYQRLQRETRRHLLNQERA